MVKKEIRKREKRGGVWWETVEKKIKERESTCGACRSIDFVFQTF